MINKTWKLKTVTKFRKIKSLLGPFTEGETPLNCLPDLHF